MDEKYEMQILAFAQKIVPKNWNVWIYKKNYKYKPHILNILLRIIDGDINEEDPLGFECPMQFCKISFDKEIMPEAMEAFKKYGDFYIAKIDIGLEPPGIYWDVWGTLVHELAHVAVERKKAWQQKAYEGIGYMVMRDIDEDLHGPLFQKAYKRMLIRAEKVLGKKKIKLKSAWSELEMYKKGLHDKTTLRSIHKQRIKEVYHGDISRMPILPQKAGYKK